MCISNVGNRRPYGATSMSMGLGLALPAGQGQGSSSNVEHMNNNNNNNSSLVGTLPLKPGLDLSLDLSFFNNDNGNDNGPEQGPLDLKTELELDHAMTKKINPHIIVHHNYHDHANDNRADYQEDHPARGGVTTPFPLRLHEMLDNITADGHDDIISWQPHGRCFVIRKPKEFSALLPHYFKLSKLASFQRQLNLYGFQRLTRGQDRGGYYHELFLRNRVFLSHNIQRLKVKGTGVRARSNPDEEPDFWSMPFVHPTTGTSPTGNDAGTSTPPLTSSPIVTATVTATATPVLQLQLEKSILGDLPLNLNLNLDDNGIPLPNPIKEDAIVCDAFEKNFHYLDPFQPTSGNWTIHGVDQLLATEAETFFEDFDFPEDIGNEIEDDNVFGDILEQMIA